MASELVDIDGDLVAPFDTEKAYRFYDGKTTVWLAKSQVEWDVDSKQMTMPRWLAEDRGLV